MSHARFLVADVFDGIATLEDQSVDLVMSSPPFLALRSYLPADHPDKPREIGSEATPGAFLDRLLDVVEALTPKLAAHGSLVFELGDTYAGSGGAGGDYNENGFREGQAKFSGSAAKRRDNGVGDDYRPSRSGRSVGWPLDKSKTCIPQLFAVALAYGLNPLTGRKTEPWRVRNTVAWCRPNPPVGRDGDKFRPATSFLTVACKARDRYWDGDAVRTENVVPKEVNDRWHARSVPERPRGRGDDNQRFTSGMHPAGAPLLDYWTIPTAPYPGAHYATWSPKVVIPVIKAMCPAFVCTACGTALGLWRESSITTPADRLSGMRRTDQEPLGNEDDAVLLEDVCEPAYGAQPCVDKGMASRREGLHPCPGTGSSNGGSERVRHGTPACDGAEVGSAARPERGSASHQRDQERQPTRELAGNGQEPARRSTQVVAPNNVPSLWRARSSEEPCPACGGQLRPGRVLDPFCGSGTTLEVATGHGLDAIGFDLDERNADLARQRVGMFLEVMG